MQIDPDLFRLYLGAAVVLVLIPGPDTLLVLTRSVAEGRLSGFVATSGITLGNMIHALAAAAGISALVAASPALFDLLRIAGAAYLGWIALKSLRSALSTWRSGVVQLDTAVLPRSGRTFVHALLTNLLNAKVILFYLAFVPQFVSSSIGNIAVQTFILGTVLAVMGCVYLLMVTVLSAGAAQSLLRNARVRAALDGLAGLIFIGFAIRLFLTERKVA